MDEFEEEFQMLLRKHLPAAIEQYEWQKEQDRIEAAFVVAVPTLKEKRDRAADFMFVHHQQLGYSRGQIRRYRWAFDIDRNQYVWVEEW